LHLHDHLICSDTGLFHRVLTIYEGPRALCVPQQQGIESSPDDVVRKGRLKRGLLEYKGVRPSPLVLIIKGGTRLDYEARLTHGVVTTQMIEDGEVRWQQRFPNVKPWEVLPFKDSHA
jgi:hypothetical protein